MNMTNIARGMFGSCAALILAASLAPVSAQSNTTGALQGKVIDEGKAVLPGTVVSIESSALIGGARTTVTGADGRFRFGDIPPGSYDVTASLSGYRTVKQTQAQVFLGRTLDISLTLTKFAGEETVTGFSARTLRVEEVSEGNPAKRTLWLDLRERFERMELSEDQKRLLDGRRSGVESGNSRLHAWDTVRSAIGRG